MRAGRSGVRATRDAAKVTTMKRRAREPGSRGAGPTHDGAVDRLLDAVRWTADGLVPAIAQRPRPARC